MMFDGGAGDVLAAGVVQDVERQDLDGCARVEHALSGLTPRRKRKRSLVDGELLCAVPKIIAPTTLVDDLFTQVMAQR